MKWRMPRNSRSFAVLRMTHLTQCEVENDGRSFAALRMTNFYSAPRERRREAEAGRASQKLRVPKWCCARSSRLVARIRPSLTCQWRILAEAEWRSSLGLRAYRQPENQLNASGPYSAFNESSCSPRPARRYRPLLAFPSFPSCDGERRSSSSPDAAPAGKTQNMSKNKSVVLLLDFSSITKSKFYVVCLQASAARSHGGDAQMVQPNMRVAKWRQLSQ